MFPQTKTPLTIPSCIGWLDASDTSTITSSGGLVSSIRNKANSLAPFVQATGANQPQTGVASLVGRNVITFNGTSHHLNCNALASAFAGEDAPVSCFSVYVPTSLGSQRTIFGAGNTGSANNLFMHDNSDVGLFRIFKRTSAGVIAQAFTTTAPSSTPVMMSMSCQGATLKAYKNNVSFIDGAFNVATIAFNQFVIGARPGPTLSNYYSGNICEQIFFNRGLSDAQVDLIENYLANKWGLTV